MMDREEQIISALLETDPLAQSSESDLSEEEQTLERLYIEVMGLLPHAVEPLAPSARAKAKLLDAIGSARVADRQEQPSVASVSAPPAATLRHRPEPRSTHAPLARQASRWPLAMAAGIALAMIGLGAMMYLRLQESEDRVARLEERLGQVTQEQVNWREEREAMALVAERFEEITAPGVEICPLRAPKSSGSSDNGATGVIYMAASQWWVQVTGLPPSPTDHAYQLWFDTDVGAISGGTFVVAADQQLIDLAPEKMPSGMRAIRVTLEPVGGALEPSGPTVLFGDQRMTLL